MPLKTETLLTAEQVAEVLGVTSRAVQKWCTAGRFPGAFKLGDATSPWRIPESAVEAFVKKQRGQS